MPESLPIAADTTESTPAVAAGTESPVESLPAAAADTDSPAESLPAAGPPAQDCGPQLKQLYPALFSNPPKPLKLRIQADIQARSPGLFTKPQLSAFLRRYTGSHGYLNAIVKATHRFDLDGNPGDELSDEHRQAAVEELARRRTNTQARRALEDEQRFNRSVLLRDFEQTKLRCKLPASPRWKGVPEGELDGLIERARKEAADGAACPWPTGDRRGPPNRGPREGAPREGGERGGQAAARQSPAARCASARRARPPRMAVRARTAGRSPGRVPRGPRHDRSSAARARMRCVARKARARMRRVACKARGWTARQARARVDDNRGPRAWPAARWPARPASRQRPGPACRRPARSSHRRPARPARRPSA